MKLLMSLLMAVFFIGGQAFAEDSACDTLEGGAQGICKAYCDVLACDSFDGNPSEKACGRLLSKYVELYGELPPCINELFGSCSHIDSIIRWFIQYGDDISWCAQTGGTTYTRAVVSTNPEIYIYVNGDGVAGGGDVQLLVKPYGINVYPEYDDEVINCWIDAVLTGCAAFK